MTKKFFQILAVAALVAVPVSFTYAKGEPSAASAKALKSKGGKKAPKIWAVIEIQFPGGGQPWKLNYPEKLLPPGAEKPEKIIIWGEVKDTVRGPVVVNKTIDARTGIELIEERPLKDATKIDWKKEEQLKDARNELVQGNAAAALAIAERFLLFFKDLKAVPGSLWLEAAVIKLDALDRQENDALLDSFIREIESAPGASEVEGLSQRIKLVRLRQLLRKGDYKRVLRESTDMIKTEDSQETLAQLTMLKGLAEFNLNQFEDALYTFLRVPVFYGNQTEFIPKAKLAAARCFLKLDGPDRAAQNLPGVAESYIMEVINEFPMTPEAKDALALLPEDRQQEIKSRDSIEEDQKRAMVAATLNSSDDGDSGDDDSDDSEISDDLGDLIDEE